MSRRRQTQLSLLPKRVLGRPDHGGDLAFLKRRKIRRPLDPTRPIHLVLKSSRARGRWSFLHHANRSKTETFIYTQAQKRDVRVYRLANVGDHLHLIVKTPSRAAFQAFLRTIACLLPRRITGAARGRPQGRFWDAPAYTRVIHWGRHYELLKAYLGKNRVEALGFGGARLRIRANGEAIVVVGDPTTMGVDPKEVEALIRGGPAVSAYTL